MRRDACNGHRLQVIASFCGSHLLLDSLKTTTTEVHRRPSSTSQCGCAALVVVACTVGALAGGMIFGLDDQLPKFEASARELVHPLFEKLKAEVGHTAL